MTGTRPTPDEGKPAGGPAPEGSPLSVRPATVDDAPAIVGAQVAAWQAAYRGIMPDAYLDNLSSEPWSRAERRAVAIANPLDPRAFNLVAELDGRVVGWLCGGPSRDDDRGPTTGEVWAIYVNPDQWRCGAGTTLMEAALDRLAAEGYSEAVLWVFEENGGARRFYERFGWRPDGASEIFERGGGQAIEIRYRRPLGSGGS